MTDNSVTQADRDAAASLIEQYYSGSSAQMLKLAASYRAGHSQGVWVRAMSAHRLAGERAGMLRAAGIARSEANRHKTNAQGYPSIEDGGDGSREDCLSSAIDCLELTALIIRAQAGEAS